MPETLKKRLSAAGTCVGAWLTVPSPLVAEAMASCGFDWMALDIEHSPIDEAAATAAFIAMERYGCAPVVRLPSADPYMARRMLDAGAVGLIVPVVEDVAEFAAFAEHCHYPPDGRRGVGVGRQVLWGDSFDDYMSNFSPILLPQIETTAGIDAADDLVALDVVDGLFLGPYDLSADLGTPGDFTTDEFEAAIAKVKQACEAHGKAPGFHQVAPQPDLLQQRLDEGYRFVAFGTDMIAMRDSFACIGNRPTKT